MSSKDTDEFFSNKKKKRSLICLQLNFNNCLCFSVAEVLNQLNQSPNQRALLRNQRSLVNTVNNSSNAAAAASSALTSSALLLNAAAVVAAATSRPPHHHSLLSGIYS